MPTGYLRRGAALLPGQTGTAAASPIYVDSDDSFVKLVPGSTGTTEKTLVDTNSAQTLTNKVITGATGVPLTEVVTATNVITAAESGTVFLLDNATGFVSTLPAPAAGLRFTFIVITAPTSGNHTIVTTTSANVIKGLQNSVAGDAGDSGTADDTISFVANQALPADKVEVISDGTSWFAYAISKVAAGITFTQAS